MLTHPQIYIIPPKKRSNAPLIKYQSVENVTSNSTPSTPATFNKHDTKLGINVIPAVRISPPAAIENPLDWDDGLFDNDKRFGRYRRSFIHRRSTNQNEMLRRPSTTAAVVVAAPLLDNTSAAAAAGTASGTPEYATSKRESTLDRECGQTLLHLAAKLGHEDIVRMLICETSYASSLINNKGQTPLLCAIEAGSTSTATLLMEQDPISLTIKDDSDSSVFHYAAEQCNDIVLSRAIALLKRLSSSNARLTALQRLVEKNQSGKTAFVIAIEKGSLKCVKYMLSSKWLHRNVDISDFINADSLKTTVDKNQLDIVSFFVSDTKRFSAVIQIQIDVNGRGYNVLEYAIALKKSDFVRVFISVRIPPEEREVYRLYKNFLRHYNFAYSGSSYDQTPIQRMLTMAEMVPLVPVLLEQFVGEDGIDLSVIDDCLRARPSAHKCIFGRSKRFSSTNWLKQHPLSLIAEANHAPVYDHDVVKMCVDLKFQLFGNFLYFLILCAQIFFVTLYTSVALISPTPHKPGFTYYDMANTSCKQMCWNMRNDQTDPLQSNILLQIVRMMLLLASCLALLKEFSQLLNQREKYFRGFFVNVLELHTYVCAIIFAVDINDCTRKTGLRCKFQWEAGALGIGTAWTLLLLVFMNALKIGKYGLLFVSVFLTFLKFCLIYKPQFTNILYTIPKTLAMLTGEYDFDDLFFPQGKFLQGSEAAMVLYSTFVFTMNIVIMNIMVGLAVSDVKRFRLNAKREHLRARIETCLGLQAKFGLLCESCSKLVLSLSKRSLFPNINQRITQLHGLKKYHLWKLELKINKIDLPTLTTVHVTNSNNTSQNKHQKHRVEQITCEVGYYRHHIDRGGEPLLQDSENVRLMRKTDELREVLEKAHLRIHHEFRKLTIALQTDFDEIKRKLLET
ncbi:unnamed protein product [Didymodactylos carnosus]|uniref:Uncharacterized protein n=1 Tax=Didymodactylos carnosus TaxID=1234261 RepID=A0A813XJ47_9BILA|nr:unnamed protein product [Didymodactylos carnosus]CAF0871334.1 unnamed protein product [Didymodactylos carnosus]CAF3522037.1 unnamed protein product [Didymodactylos carnosus]CAF3658628.1 unnamed protein product [Didymodactylos carnosus]